MGNFNQIFLLVWLNVHVGFSCLRELGVYQGEDFTFVSKWLTQGDFNISLFVIEAENLFSRRAIEWLFGPRRREFEKTIFKSSHAQGSGVEWGEGGGGQC